MSKININNIKVSVIVPVYNVEEYLHQCIESLLAQSMKDIEIILVDDGSTDSSGEICDTFAYSHTNVIVRHQKNAGPAAARNYGLELATGEWIMFVDADDKVHTEICNKLYNMAMRYDADMVFCNMTNKFADGKVLYEAPFSEQLIVFDRSSKHQLEVDVVAQKAQTGCLVGPYCKLLKKACIADIRFPDSINLGEDACFMMKVLKKLDKIVYLNEHLYERNIHQDSLSFCQQKEESRRASFINWVCDYYKEDKNILMKNAVTLLTLKNLIRIIDVNFQPGFRMNRKTRIQHVKQYLKNTKGNTVLTFKIIIQSELGRGSKIKLLLYYLHLYGILQLAFAIKWKNNNYLKV